MESIYNDVIKGRFIRPFLFGSRKNILSVEANIDEKEGCIYLHFDVELQNDYRPGYPIPKRSIYYAAREISEQLGILTEITDYSSVEKVYCIWICNNKKMPKKLQNTVSEYYIAKRDLIGHVEEPKEDYDLIDIIMIRRGDESSDEQILDYLNNLCRKICKEKPDAKEMRRQFEEVMGRPEQKWYTHYAAGILGGTGFAVFFGCDIRDAIIAVIVSIVIVAAGNWLAEREKNLLAYNLILSFIAEMIILLSVKFGFADHEERIMIGIVMLLISGLSTTNGIRDLLQKDFISGSINIMNSMLGASGIAFGTAIPMILFGGVEAEGFILTPNLIVQLISCTAACVGFALWFKIRGMQVVYCGIGAFFTWLIYALVYEARPSNFLATTIAATFVAFYAFIMSRINKAPSTIFLTASVFPLIPGPNLYYVMYACVSGNMHMLLEQTITLFATCVAIAFGFNFVDIASRTIMRGMKVEYHIGKSDR